MSFEGSDFALCILRSVGDTIRYRVEEAEMIMSSIYSINRSILGMGWLSGISFKRPITLDSMLKVLLHFDIFLLWLGGGRSSKG